AADMRLDARDVVAAEQALDPIAERQRLARSARPLRCDVGGRCARSAPRPGPRVAPVAERRLDLRTPSHRAAVSAARFAARGLDTRLPSRRARRRLLAHLDASVE